MASRRVLPRLASLRHQLQAVPRTQLASHSTPTLGARSMSTMEVPKTMKGVVVEKTGGVEVLQYRTDLPVPVPKDGEILVKNEVCGVNYIDIYFRTGLYPSNKPEILGRDAAGYAMTTSPINPVVIEGSRVVFMGTGAYAEYTVVPAQAVAPVPAHISLSTACAAVLQGLTAITLIDEAHKVNAGDWVLVPAAAGGVGGWLCQLLHARGAHTIATASTPEKRQLALDAGADVAVPYEEALDAVKEHTNGEGVVAVFDGVGQATFETAMQAVGRKGTIASFGNASGAVEPFRIARLAEKNVKICRPTLFNYIKTPSETARYTRELWEAIGEEDGKGGPGHVKVPVHEVYPLSEIQRAHTDIEGRKTTGKLLLDPSK